MLEKSTIKIFSWYLIEFITFINSVTYFIIWSLPGTGGAGRLRGLLRNQVISGHSVLILGFCPLSFVFYSSVPKTNC